VKILAVDTSTRQLNVAVVEDEGERVDLSLNAGQTHSKHLMPMIDTALNLAGLDLTAIDGFAVTVGPGSFTGLRIGLSAVKGLASALNKPVAGVSSLDALAYPWRGLPFLICALLDARKKEIYSALYRFNGNRLLKIREESVLSIEKAVGEIDEKCLFAGSGALLHQRVISDKIGECAIFPSPEAHVIRATSVARLGLCQFMNRQECSAAEIFPRYLRSSN
jgi:tRNA threonylcarbamoyladenosine biosynthesis protein TsaB